MECRFCGAPVAPDDLLHALHCDGQQGRVEAGWLSANYHAPYAAGRETSAAAALSVEPTAQSLCGVIYDALKHTTTGLTCSEVETRFSLTHQTASARIWDLHTRGFITDSGARRPSLTGRASIVWIRAIRDVAVRAGGRQ